MRLIRTKGGVDAALEYAKSWSRYVKELLAWTEKRASYGEGSSGPAPGPALGPAVLAPRLTHTPVVYPQSWSLPKTS